MKLNLDEENVRTTINKNTTTSYGLTLVIGLPFPAELSRRIQSIQRQLETVLPGRFTWYGPDHLHATLMALLRGRYRKASPLQRAELPADLQGFINDLVDFLAQSPSFPLNLAGLQVTPEGFIIIRGDAPRPKLAAFDLQKYPELDPPKHSHAPHITIGYFNTSQLFVTDKERSHVEETLDNLHDTCVGRIIVRQISLVHYSNRTLARIAGKVPLRLGQSNRLTAEDLLRQLGIIVP